MNNQPENRQLIGIVIFLFTAAFPGAMLAGFLVPWPWSFESALALASAGGLVGGALLAPRLLWAGALGGLIAGPLSLAALYYYAHGREQIWSVEMVIVQAVASLPGLAFYWFVAYLIPASGEDDFVDVEDNETIQDDIGVDD